MWQALTEIDKLWACDIALCSNFMDWQLSIWGWGWGVFQAVYVSRKDAAKPSIYGGLKNNYLLLPGLAFCYLIITVVPGDFSLGCWPWRSARTIDILTKDWNMLTQCPCRDARLALSAESQLERKRRGKFRKRGYKKKWMWWSAARARRLQRPPPPSLPPSLQPHTHTHARTTGHTTTLPIAYYLNLSLHLPLTLSSSPPSSTPQPPTHYSLATYL